MTPQPKKTDSKPLPVLDALQSFVVEAESCCDSTGCCTPKPSDATGSLSVVETPQEESTGCCESTNTPKLGRREFLQVAGIGAVATTGVGFSSVMAGGFNPGDVNADYLVPADKKLDPAWVRSLYERGTKETFTGDALKIIGMPCGGIAAGQLYLTGDGTLGEWQIFNDAKSHWVARTASTYTHLDIAKDVTQGFGVTIRNRKAEAAMRVLSSKGFSDVKFNGEYPIGNVHYEDGESPVSVHMEAFSPFIPLDAKSSALPATVFHMTVKNVSDAPLQSSIVGWLENAVCRNTADVLSGERVTSIDDSQGSLMVRSMVVPPPADAKTERETILFEDFEKPGFKKWKVEGKAFGENPSRGTETTQNQNPVWGFEGKQLLNSFALGDGPTGTMSSEEFKIDRNFINLLVGGGRNRDKICIRLLVNGKVVRSATGRDSEQLSWTSWDVKELAGKTGHFEIVDMASGGWGHILVDTIEFSDSKRLPFSGGMQGAPDYGTMTLAALNPAIAEVAIPNVGKASLVKSGKQSVKLTEKLVGALGTEEVELAPGKSHTFTFVLAWSFPNGDQGNYYAKLFPGGSDAVAKHVLENSESLTEQTRLWRDTYYASTMPYWLLDRLFSTVSILASGTCRWWENGRFWAWEGVSCCTGTCTHVWNYAHAHARLFPELAMSIRKMQDYNPRKEGGGYNPESGLVGFRSNGAYAADGQCGSVLKAYREHLISKDSAFLKEYWPRIKKSLEFLMAHDENADGIIEDSQHNTYDINYEGPNTFIGALYLAALRAGEEMAKEIGDDFFAKECRSRFEKGSKATEERLWDGEYFFQEVDLKKHPRFQYGKGCLADQMFGQGWAHQVGLGHLYSKEKVVSALKSVWKYNWAPDIAPYNKAFNPERWFITPGQAGLFICTWPKSEHLDLGSRYKDEVWTGIEYQVAGHMIAEGLIEEGLAICKAVHERYHGENINPYNEVECGDHYARAMASWGVYLMLCGFDYNGPKQHMAFAPKINQEDFKCAFTAAEGWGSYEQKITDGKMQAVLSTLWGTVDLKSISLSLPGNDSSAAKVTVEEGKAVTQIQFEMAGEAKSRTINFAKPVKLGKNARLVIAID